MNNRSKFQRVGIFIDIQNLYHSAKHLYGGRVNYRELIRELVGARQLIRTMGYVVKSETVLAAFGEPRSEGRTGLADGREERISEGESRDKGRRGLTSEAAFFDALTKNGIELRMKDLQVFPGGMKKADWDVGMAVDAIRMASFLDVIVLVTGDGDFIPLVEYLKWGLGRVVEVAAFGRSASGKLKEAADYFINLEELPKVMLKR